MKKLDEQEIHLGLQNLVGWKFNGNVIEKEFSFRNFSETFSLMSRIAMLAERMGHHPDWSGGYNKLHIQLRTHDADGITQNDLDMATEIETYIR